MNKGKRLLGILLVGVLTVGMVWTAKAANVSDMKDKQQQLEDQQKKAESEKASLAAKVNALSASMQQAEANLNQKQSEIEAAEEELVAAKLDENKQYENMKLRIRYMYENGNVNFIEIFIESNSLADFFAKTESISKISEYDRKKLEEFQLTVRAVEEKELELQAEYQTLAKLQETIATQQAEAKALLAEKASELAKINADLSTLKGQIKRAEDEAKRQQELAEANQKPNGSGSGGSSSTGQAKPPTVSGNGYFTHPCPGMSYQSSYFGEVRHGIGDTTPHKGHDYAAPKGTPIYAAAAGTVIIAGYSSSAGYWVVIDHGNGLVTKYMHMFERPYVSAGRKVVKGQHIGGVGSTGQSTGNHLHFQVELNRVPVNPSNYM